MYISFFSNLLEKESTLVTGQIQLVQYKDYFFMLALLLFWRHGGGGHLTS